MRAPIRIARVLGPALGIGLVIVMLSAAGAAAKGEGAGIITLAAPIPRDAEPGSTIAVEFTATMPGADGSGPVVDSPMVLRLTGPDGGSTEATGVETSTPGTYRVSIKVPAGGIDKAVFGLRGSSINPDGSTALADIPFDVDGVLLAMSHPNPVAPAAAPPSATPPNPAPSADLRPAALVALVAAGAIVAAVIAFGRRRTLRTTS